MDRGKIPQTFIDDLLSRVDIIDVISPRIKLKRAGQNHMGLCPFHNEKSPSFSVNQNKQFFHCFGCGEGGNAITFLMEYEHLDFVPAIEELARIAGVEVPRDESPQDIQKNKQQRALYDILKKAADIYYDNLKSSPQKQLAINYLKARGLTGQTAKQFQIGFAPDAWSNLLDKLKSEGIDPQLLVLAGLVVENDNGKTYDRFRNRIQFPIRDARGRYIGFGGRVINPDDKPKYLNSPETPVFHKGKELYGLYEAKMSNRQLTKALIVEGYMDVVVLAQYGIQYAMATLGTSTSQVHLERLFKILSDVIFCFDGDKAGRAAAFRALEVAIPMLEDGRQIRFMFLPDGEDPDSLIQKEGKEAFEERIRHALPLIELIFQNEKDQVDFESLDGKASYAKAVISWINKLPPKGLIRSLAIKRLADITGLDADQLKQQLIELPTPQYVQPTAESRHQDVTPVENIQSTHVDISSTFNKKNQSILTPAMKLIANIIRLPELRHELNIPALIDNNASDVRLLLNIIDLLNSRPRELTEPLLLLQWLKEQGMEKPLLFISESDYFWLPKPGSPIEPKAWIKEQFEKNRLYLIEKLPDDEYLALKNRMTNHTSEVTEEEINRFNELTKARKRYRAK